MPFRCMQYDTLEYHKQIREIVKKNKQAGGYGSEEEFLSKFKRSDKMYPVITLVFYHGTKPYDGCKSLHDMLEFNQIPEEYKGLVPDYKINLVELKDLDIEKFDTNLREVIGLMKYSSSKEELKKYVEDNKERISHMDEDAYDTASVMINHKNLLDYKVESKKRKGGLDMCQAILDMIEDGRAEGRTEGKVEGRGDAVKIIKLYHKNFEVEEIAGEMGLSVEEVQQIISDYEEA